MPSPAKIFISYSHKDKKWLDRLQVVLKPLVSGSKIETWADTGLEPGDDWLRRIKEAIAVADVAVLLVSLDFLASDFIQNVELPLLLEAKQIRNLKIISVAVRSSNFEVTELEKYQFANDTARPLASLRGDHRDAALTAIARKIAGPPALPPPEPPRPANLHGTKPWNVPHERNPFFTGREDVLKSLHDSLTSGKAAALSQAIRGLGGVGKTQTAVEYAYRYQDEYSAVLWTGADTEADLIAGFAQIAGTLVLSQAQEADQNLAVAAAKRWLENNTGWLLIFDNANTPELVKPYRPHNPKGHILLTSRAHTFDKLVIVNPTELASMPPEEAAEFLFTRTGRDRANSPEELAAKDLAKELGFLPLALEQAAAYILANDVPFSSYLISYRKNPSKPLKKHEPVAGDYKDTVATTWSLNFAEVEKTSSASADLLHISAFLAPDSIPFDLIIAGASKFSPALSDALRNAGEDPLVIDEVIGPLTRYSLVRLEGSSFSIHRLLQAVVRDRLTAQEKNRWSKRIISGLNRALPIPDFANWSFFESAVPHVQATINILQEIGAVKSIETIDAARLMNRVAYYLDDRARYSESEPLFERALAISEESLGLDDPFTATSLNDMATLYVHLGRYSESEPLYKRALSIREKCLGPNDPKIAESLNSLAYLYRSQGHYAEAEPLIERALSICEKSLGPNHPETGTSLDNLAGLYESQGRYAEAQPLYERALAVCVEALAPDHTDTVASLNNLAGLHRSLGRYAESEPLYKRALAICVKSLGPDHTDTAASLNNLALLYKNQGRYAEAEPLYEHALAICEKSLGPDHPFTAASLNNLAGLYKNQDRYAEAEPLYERALAIREKSLGPDHADTAQSLNNLAGLYESQGRYAEAQPLYERALAIRERSLGTDHPNTAQSLNSMAGLYKKQGSYSESELLYKRALAIWEKYLGLDHPNVAACCENYGDLMQKLGRQAEGEALIKRAEEIRRKRREEGLDGG